MKAGDKVWVVLAGDDEAHEVELMAGTGAGFVVEVDGCGYNYAPGVTHWSRQASFGRTSAEAMASEIRRRMDKLGHHALGVARAKAKLLEAQADLHRETAAAAAVERTIPDRSIVVRRYVDEETAPARGDKPTVAVDFDGVLHRYSRGWTGPGDVYDEPTAGALQAVEDLVQHFRVVVFTARARTPGGASAVHWWLRLHGFPGLEVTAEKPPAVVYLDDRAMRFDGRWDGIVDAVRAFRPWTATGEAAPAPTTTYKRKAVGMVDALVDDLRQLRDGVVESPLGHIAVEPVAEVALAIVSLVERLGEALRTLSED